MAREQRKLAAIVAADVVGYSRLMGRDESGTLARLRKNRTEHLDPVLTRYGGRLVKLTGDGALIEFGSAVDALSAAIEFQQAMALANTGQPTDTALVFRMGLHLGDLIVDGDDLYGDGVNIAARLEAEAPPGGIIVSRAVRDAVAGRLQATLEDLGTAAARAIELDGTDALAYALRGLVAFLGGQIDRYAAGLTDARRAHELNPNDTAVLGILSTMEAAAGEPERGIEHAHMVLRLNPRAPRRHGVYSLLALASFGAKQYAEGVIWGLRALNEAPRSIHAHFNLTICLVGAGEIDKAKSVFEAGQKLGPEYFKIRLKGEPLYARPEDDKRQHMFLRIAAGLEDPSAAEAFR